MKIPLLIAFLLVHLSPAAAQWTGVGSVDLVGFEEAGKVTVRAGEATLRLTVVHDDIIRIRLTPPGQPMLPDEVPGSPALADPPRAGARASIADTPDSLLLSTPKLQVTLTKRPLRITVRDESGRILCEDHPDKGMCWAGQEVRVWKRMPSDEHYYGFGEKSGRLMRKNHHMTMWNSDIPAYGADTDPLYKSIPFFLAVRGGRAHGVFFDNPSRTSFDMGKEARDQYSFGAENGELDYYVLSGPTPEKVVEQFTLLTGRLPLPPRWSLGYQQCRWSYAPEQRVRDIAHGFRSRRIPCDVIYLDIDYMDGYRIFTWNPKGFPDPPRLIGDLSRDGFRVAVIVDPGIKVDTAYEAYRTGLAGGHFLRYPDGRVYVGEVWPGRCAFPDFSSPQGRDWWGKSFSELVRDGVRGWWNDMNEPSVFNVPTKTVDLSVLHHDEGRLTPHTRNHNLYGMRMTRATYEGVRALLPDERPFVLTRATFAGGQRYSAVWTGDNVASWDHLRLSLTMCLNLGLSGQAFVGSDIGGFIGFPSGELFARWLQLGVFTPLMRGHSVINERNKEPWEFGERYTDINRTTIELRYRLLPTLYTLMAEASESGRPVMRPMIFSYPEDPRFVEEDRQFMVGENLLVAPVLSEGDTTRDVQLPGGTWYDWWTGQPHTGGGTVRVMAPLDRIPMFVRSGGVIALQQPVQHTGEAPVDPLTFIVYPPESGERTTACYEDDGLSYRYLQGEYLKRGVTVRRGKDSVIVTVGAAEGTYRPPTRSVEIHLPEARTVPGAVLLDGAPVKRSEAGALRSYATGWVHIAGQNLLIVRMDDTRSRRQVVIRF